MILAKEVLIAAKQIFRKRQSKELYQCEECGFKYEEKEWAEKCEQWCREHKSCNIEITRHAREV